MEEDTIFVLFDLGGDFKEGEDDRRGLGLRQRGVLEGVGAQRMMQSIGRTREQQSHRIGQEGGRRGPITVEVHFHRLDIVFAIPTGAIEVFVEHLRGRSVQRGDDKAGVIARAHDFRLEHDPPWAHPGLGRIGELVIEAATGGRRLAVGVSPGDPLMMETTCRLEGGSGLPEQDGIASKPKDKIRPTPLGDHVDDLWRRKMTIATDQNMGVRPMVAQIRQQPDQDHRIFGSSRAGPWAQVGRDQRVRGPFENEERQIAMVLIVMIIESKLLLTMRGIIGVVYIEDRLLLDSRVVDVPRSSPPTFGTHSFWKPFFFNGLQKAEQFLDAKAAEDPGIQ